ncbi:alpha/beta hydrolase family protein [Pseudomonas akapageensis]|uniref:alpha/beta hydrolase family protein n=1 Tax=Pseudomonas akapageensis TaxID=2609961 RepID=UPI00140C4BF8|nr:alpha/beta hydrolase family protein [Pseudomonas akapageensis]
MFRIYRTTLSAFCLTLILPCYQSAVAEDTAQKTTGEPAAAVRQPLLERSQEDALALERQLPLQEQQTLSAGSDSFLALWKPANSSDPEGAVVIVPGAGETADWPQAVSPLRRKLPDARWHSLSLTLPDLLADTPLPRATEPVPTATPPATASSSQATPLDANASVEQATARENENADKTLSAEQEQNRVDAERIFARIEAGITYAQQQKARTIVLLGHGSGAYWAARYLSERQPHLVQKFVMVAAQSPVNANPGLDALAPGLKLPTADFYYSDRPQARKAAEQRLQASKRLKDSGYSQVSLKALPGNGAAEQEQLFRRVRGWLSPEAKPSSF